VHGSALLRQVAGLLTVWESPLQDLTGPEGGRRGIATSNQPTVSVAAITPPRYLTGLVYAQLRCRRVQHAIDNDRVALHLRIFERILRIVGPRHFQQADILTSDLRQGPIANIVGTTVDRPLNIATLNTRDDSQAKNWLR
jgi:hypothetical protein